VTVTADVKAVPVGGLVIETVGGIMSGVPPFGAASVIWHRNRNTKEMKRKTFLSFIKASFF
jgi:hypothetical protein